MEAVEVIRSLGLPTGVLVLVLLGGWRISRWLGENVFKPLTLAHITFLGTMTDTLHKQSHTLETIAQTQDRQTRLQEDHADELRALRESLERGRGT